MDLIGLKALRVHFGYDMLPGCYISTYSPFFKLREVCPPPRRYSTNCGFSDHIRLAVVSSLLRIEPFFWYTHGRFDSPYRRLMGGRL